MFCHQLHLALCFVALVISPCVLAQSAVNFCAVSSGVSSAWTVVTTGQLMLGTNNVVTAISGTRTVYVAATGSSTSSTISGPLTNGSLLGGLTSSGLSSTTGNDNIVTLANSGVAQLSGNGLAFSLALALPLPAGNTASLTYTNVSNILLFNALQLGEAGSTSTGSSATIVQSAPPVYSSFTAATGPVSCPAAAAFTIPSSAAPTLLNFCYQSVSASSSYSSSTSGQLTVTSASLAGNDNDYLLGAAVTVVNISGNRVFYSPSTGTVTSTITGLAAPRSGTNQQGYPTNNFIAVQGSNSGWLDRSGLTFTVSPPTYLGPDFTASASSAPIQTSVVNLYEITGYVESGLKGSPQPVADLVYLTISQTSLSCPLLSPSSVGTLQWSWSYNATAGATNWTVVASGLLITTNVTQPVADFGSSIFEGGLPYPASGYKLLGISGSRTVIDSGNTAGLGAGYTTTVPICGTVPTSIGDEQPDNLLFISVEQGVLLSQAGIGYRLSSPSILPLVMGSTINDVNLFFMNHTSPYATTYADQYAEANGKVESGAPYEPISSTFIVSQTSGQSISAQCTTLGGAGPSNSAFSRFAAATGTAVVALVMVAAMLVSMAL